MKRVKDEDIIKKFKFIIYVNQMLTNSEKLTPRYTTDGKKYYKFKCELLKVYDNPEGFWITYNASFCEGFKLFDKWFNCGVFTIYSEHDSTSLIQQCEDFLISKGHDVLVGESVWEN